jgi:hypothetical protein
MMENVTLQDVRLIYRNFAGKAIPPYNPEGARNFCVVLDDLKLAEAMGKDGWNVKFPVPRDDEDDRAPHLKVIVKYRNIKGELTRPPRVVLITSRGKTELDEDTIASLDYANIKNVDLIVRPYEYKTASGQEGISAYLQSIYVTIEEDELELKYAALDNQGAHDGLEFR